MFWQIRWSLVKTANVTANTGKLFVRVVYSGDAVRRVCFGMIQMLLRLVIFKVALHLEMISTVKRILCTSRHTVLQRRHYSLMAARWNAEKLLASMCEGLWNVSPTVQ
jgi:hypothetical protein